MNLIIMFLVISLTASLVIITSYFVYLLLNVRSSVFRIIQHIPIIAPIDVHFKLASTLGPSTLVLKYLLATFPILKVELPIVFARLYLYLQILLSFLVHLMFLQLFQHDITFTITFITLQLILFPILFSTHQHPLPILVLAINHILIMRHSLRTIFFF